MKVLEGIAEAIPLSDAAVDAVVVGTAFHWFRRRGAWRRSYACSSRAEVSA